MREKRVFAVILMVAVLMCVGFAFGYHKDTKDIKKTEATGTSYSAENESINYELLQKIRVGFCQSLPDSEATGILYYTLMSLQDRGLIKGMNNYFYKPFYEDSRILWEYVCKNVKSDYIEFDESFFYDLEDDDTDNVIDELNKNRVDLLLAYGTKAGTDLFNEKHHTYILNFGANDPIGSGYVKSANYSGYDHLWAHVDSEKYYKQIEFFHQATGFKKLGAIIYTDSHRSILTPIDEMQSLANEKGIEYKIYEFDNVDEIFSTKNRVLYYEKLIKIHEQIAEECDAFYMVMGGWEYEDLQMLLKPFTDKGVPVFSQLGSAEVKNGALMSIGKIDFSDIGSYLSYVILQIANGHVPGEIDQQYSEILGLSVNMSMAKKIGFQFPVELMLNCYEIFE